MRVSTLKSDVGYTPFPQFYEVYVDGEYMTHCVTADEQKGYADVYELDDEGRPKRSEYGDPCTVRINGHVEIRKLMAEGK